MGHNIDFYIDICHKLYDETVKLLDAAEEENIDNILFHLDQRQSLMNIIQEAQNNNKIDQSNQLSLLLNDIINEVFKIDDIINQKLLSLKDRLHFEIAKTYKTKENLKGYNLNNLK